MSMSKSLRIIVATAATVLVTGCGGGGGGGGPLGGSPATATLSGVAAVGTPIVQGTIKVVCAAGSPLGQTHTNGAGAWQISLSGQTLPCAVQVSGGTINGAGNPSAYHSVAISAGTVNVTPITDLLVANMVGNATLSSWFTGLSTGPAPLSAMTQAQVDTAVASLNAAFPTLPLYSNGKNPITSAFTPTAGDPQDDMLSAIGAAMTNASVTHSTLLNSAAATSFQPPAGLASALTAAYQGTTSGRHAVYYPVNVPLTIFNSTPLTIDMTGYYKGRSVALTDTRTSAPASQTFLGQPATALHTVGTLFVDGVPVSSVNTTDYFSAAPFKTLGSSSTSGYTVYANQVPLPMTATIGSSGSFDTGIGYADSTQATVLDTFVETWSLQAGATPDTASLCINTIATAVASSETSGTSSVCLTIDASGNINQVVMVVSIDGETMSLTSTRIQIAPPTVQSTNPTNYASSVSANSTIAVTFDRPIDPATITEASFTLSGPSSTPVSGTVTSSGTTATFTPSTPLAANTFYTATITTAVKDLAGTALRANYSWWFQTKAIPVMVSTFAGTGTQGSSNGSGATASFWGPSGLAIDGAGNLYVADSNNSIIRKVTPDRNVRTLAGTGEYGSRDGPSDTATFSRPNGIALDAASNVYVIDWHTSSIRKIVPSGQVTTLAVVGNLDPANRSGLPPYLTPYLSGIAIDRGGHIYVSDSNNNVIRMIEPDGSVSTFAGTGLIGSQDGPRGSVTFSEPKGLAVDGQGNLYVADGLNYSIRKISADGNVSTLAKTQGQPVGIAVDSKNYVYVTTSNGAVYQITAGGIISVIAGRSANVIPIKDGPGVDASFCFPDGIAIDSTGNLYISDGCNNAIRKVVFQ